MTAKLDPLLNQIGGGRKNWPLQLGLSLTLLDLLLQPIGDWFIRPWVLLIAAAGLMLPAFRNVSWPWLILAALAAARVTVTWPLADNHAYLIGYWGLAAFLALRTTQPGPVLARTAAILLGLVFLFATLWKALSTDYMDGRFFALTLISDPRFQDFVQVVGRMTTQTLNYNRDVLEMAVAGPTREPEAFQLLVGTITWWTLIIEGALAVAWLIPTQLMRRLRHWLTLVFCITTYAVATVAGFGWLVVAMAVTTLDQEEKRTAICYVVTFALILVFKFVPVWSLLNV